MATVQTLLDDLNQRLGDAANSDGVGEATKIRWIENGIAAMYPRVYTIVVDAAAATIDPDVYEYELPAAFDDAEIYRIEVQTGPSLERWTRVDRYLIDKRADKVLTFDQLPGIEGADIRVTAFAPCDNSSLTTASVLDFPDRFRELPVWYALGLAMQNGHQHYARLDYSRYSTTVNRNGVDVGELMSSSQYCFAQFELLLDRLGMAPPAG